MRRRTIVSGLTLVVLLAVLAGMALWGYRQVTQPFSPPSASADECSADEITIQRTLSRGDVQVSVFNSGRTSGAAGRTMDRLEGLGFLPGEIGNAPAGLRVPRALVRTTTPDDTAARLVAAALGPRTRIEVTADDLGPGIDVVVGDQLTRLNAKAPQELELPEPVERCVRVD